LRWRKDKRARFHYDGAMEPRPLPSFSILNNRISELLKEYPQIIKVFLQASHCLRQLCSGVILQPQGRPQFL